MKQVNISHEEYFEAIYKQPIPMRNPNYFTQSSLELFDKYNIPYKIKKRTIYGTEIKFEGDVMKDNEFFRFRWEG